VTLVGARVAVDAASSKFADPVIRDGRIHFPATAPRDSETTFDLSGYLLLPGLLNAHDHLALNLLPRLGRGIYANASEWAREIYQPEASPLREHLAVPKAVRLAWGGIRNLLCGATTVCHHDRYEAAVFENNFPVRVVREFGWAHSLAFSPELRAQYRDHAAHLPFVIHAAEGTDQLAQSEIAQLEKMAVLGGNTVLVHAIGLAKGDVPTLLRRRSSLVWCPRSNLLTYGRTLTPEVLRSGIPVALGTDSAISAEGDLLDDIRAAVECGMSPAEVYAMVTSGAAQVLRLRNREGTLAEAAVADFVAVADEGQTPAEAILNLHPELVVIGGRVKLVSEKLAASGIVPGARSLQRIELEGKGMWRIDADVVSLHRVAAKVIGAECRVAGRRVFCSA
jgi:cytosine/adenosine deaminase-related metal-dependent hydrolase